MCTSARNRQTLAAYEQIADDYAESTKGTPHAASRAMLERFAAALPSGGAVLELGSGPGWDADFLESSGLCVRRTDATAAFCDLQRARGRDAERLDAITDPYVGARWPVFDGVLALYVLPHIERGDTDAVLRKAADALRPGGTLLVTVRKGIGEGWEDGESGRRYHVTSWAAIDFEMCLRRAGFEPLWTDRLLDDEGPWLGYLARRSTDE